MPRKLEDLQADTESVEKELTRKLYWTVSSTLPLTREQKKTTFTWAAHLAEQLVRRAAAAPPPASRPISPSTAQRAQRLASGAKNRYAAQAGGGAADGKIGRRTVQPKPYQNGRLATPPLDQDSWDLQVQMRERAILYMKNGSKSGATREVAPWEH